MCQDNVVRIESNDPGAHCLKNVLLVDAHHLQFLVFFAAFESWRYFLGISHQFSRRWKPLEEAPARIYRAKQPRFRELRLCFTKEQNATRIESVMQPLQYALLSGGIEINQEVAADHQIAMRDGRVANEVAAAKNQQPANFATNT